MKKNFTLYITLIVFGWLFGWFGGTIYTYYTPNIIVYHAAKDPKFGLSVIKDMINQNQALNDAIAVISTQSAPQFGKEFNNTLTNEGRASIIAHPYDKQGSGVAVVVSYTDAKLNTKKILLLRKLKIRNKPSEGLKNEFNMVAGYTKGAAVEGSSIRELSFKEEEARDAAEDEYLVTGKLKAQSPLKETSFFATKDYFEKLKSYIVEFYKNQLKADPYIKNMDPTEIKKYLQSKGVTYNRDYNFLDTAMREFKEESGYNGTITPGMFKALYTSDNYAITNIPALHTIATYLIADLGNLDKEPHIYPAGYEGARTENSFQPNGTEIGQLEWVDISAIEPDEEGGIKHNDINVPDLSAYNNAIKQLRDEELQKQSNGIIISREHLQQMIRHTGLTLELKKLNTEFGIEASKSHQLNRCIAHKLAEKPMINSEIISSAWNKCKDAS